MNQHYPVPEGMTEVTYEIKKSRFIARLAKVSDREQAMAFLGQSKIDYPDARHHCWAYIFGSPSHAESAAMSDDGEPSGTAGKPILNVMQHKSIGDVMVVVIRYFGGIKLGAGGLVRAYSHAAQQAYDHASTIEHIQLDDYQINCNFADEQSLRHWLDQREGQVINVLYSETVCMDIALENAYFDELARFIASLKGAELISP